MPMFLRISVFVVQRTVSRDFRPSFYLLERNYLDLQGRNNNDFAKNFDFAKIFDFAKFFAKLAVVVNADTVGKLFCFKKKKK